MFAKAATSLGRLAESQLSRIAGGAEAGAENAGIRAFIADTFGLGKNAQAGEKTATAAVEKVSEFGSHRPNAWKTGDEWKYKGFESHRNPTFSDSGIANPSWQSRVDNPNLDMFRRSIGMSRDSEIALNKGLMDDAGRLRMDAMKIRDEATKTFGYSPLHQRALDYIKQAEGPGGIVDLGAGTGDVSRMLSQMGAKVTAYDKFPIATGKNPYGFKGQTFKVNPGDEQELMKHPDSTLLMVWPAEWANAALVKAEQAGIKRLVFVGEGRGGSTGTGAFFSRLNRNWEQEHYIPLPSWPQVDNGMTIFRRPA
jgi:hypothetical protein